MIGWETEIKLQNISKQEFSCNRSSLGVPVNLTGSKGLDLVPAARFSFVRIKFG